MGLTSGKRKRWMACTRRASNTEGNLTDFRVFGFRAGAPRAAAEHRVNLKMVWYTSRGEMAINNGEHIRAYGPYYLPGQSCPDNVTGGWMKVSCAAQCWRERTLTLASGDPRLQRRGPGKFPHSELETLHGC